MNLLTKMWSPIRRVSSMEPEGILKACRNRVRTIRAMISATPNASAYSRAFPFFATVTPPGIFCRTWLLLDLEDGEERFLRDFDGADLLHPLLPLLLLFQELPLSRDVAAVAFRDEVLPDS